MLHIENLHTHYGPIEALKGIDLDIHEGEIVTLIGANGAGKSTLLNTICGSPRASAGKIEYRGENLTRRRTKSASAASPSSPKDGASSRRSPSKKTSNWAASTRQKPKTKKAWSTSTSFSRASWSGAASARAPSPAANSKCSPSAAD